jgi:hypothetical protein
MITKFKIFENSHTYSVDLFWVLPIDDRFIPSLQEIKCPKNIQRELKRDLKNSEYGPSVKFAIIFFASHEDMNPWRLASIDHIKLFQGSEYKFAGYVNIEDYELDVEKYNL